MRLRYAISMLGVLLLSTSGCSGSGPAAGSAASGQGGTAAGSGQGGATAGSGSGSSGATAGSATSGSSGSTGGSAPSGSGSGSGATAGSAMTGGAPSGTSASGSGASGSSATGSPDGGGSPSSGDAAASAHCTNPTHTLMLDPSNAQNGITLSGFYVDADTWNIANYQVSQTLYICDYNNWYVVANMNNDSGDGAVKTYPDVHEDFDSAPAISSFATIASTFAHTAPHVGIYEFAYDIWLNGVATNGSTEVMIWTDNYNQVPSVRRLRP